MKINCKITKFSLKQKNKFLDINHKCVDGKLFYEIVISKQFLFMSIQFIFVKFNVEFDENIIINSIIN